MNYINTRYFIYFTVLLIYFLLRKYKIIKLKKRVLDVIILIVPLILLFSISFEKNIVRFNTLEEVFAYNYPRKEIFETYLKENYAFVIFTDMDSYGTTHFIKDEKGWVVTNPNREHTIISGYDEYTVVTNEIEEINVLFIKISYFSKINKQTKIVDSLGTEFDIKIETNDYGTQYSHRGIIETTDDYYIQIDGKKKRLPDNIFTLELKDY